jgi:hypothetical protein
MKKLSEYYDENTKRKATVFQSSGKYYVAIMTDTGTAFSADFASEETAEVFAEDWVQKDE